jgi:hypothetical protein
MKYLGECSADEGKTEEDQSGALEELTEWQKAWVEVAAEG